jgi:hypothetical protein
MSLFLGAFAAGNRHEHPNLSLVGAVRLTVVLQLVALFKLQSNLERGSTRSQTQSPMSVAAFQSHVWTCRPDYRS